MRLFLKLKTEFYTLLVALYILLTPLLVFAADVCSTVHNLSVSGPGPVKATTETQTCKFCHTPHNADPAYPLWNHQPSAVQNYINYWSPTLKSYSSAADAPPIDGVSKLCLGCHDGTIALGALVVKEETVQTVPEYMTVGMKGYLGTDLSGGHPISIVYDQALVNLRNSDPNIMHLNWPISDRDVKLYPTQGGYGVQCISCHEYPCQNKWGASAPPSAPPCWQKATYDEVCLVCHDISLPVSTPGAGH
jgi:hypothetical protein